MDTFYRHSAPDQIFSLLEEKIETDICIIGGGFAGLNTALGLWEREAKNIVLLEKEDVGFGASGRNGGFVFAGYSLSPKELVQQCGLAKAQRLYQGTRDGVSLIRHRMEKYNIDCDETQGVLLANWFKDPSVLKDHQEFLQENFNHVLENISPRRLRTMLHTERYSGALLEHEGFHFHPLKYAQGLAKELAKNIKIYMHSPAVSLSKQENVWVVKTPQGEVIARTVVVACGGYLSGLSATDKSILPIATYVVTTPPLEMDDVMTTRHAIYDTRFAFDYYRPLPDNRLLWGGRISVSQSSPENIKHLLKKDMCKVFPQLKNVDIDFAWSGLMSYARHQMPQVGEVEPGLWITQGFGGHGVAPTTMMGEVLAEAILKQSEKYKDFKQFGFASTHKPAGFAAAQMSYWWAQAKDQWKDAWE